MPRAENLGGRREAGSSSLSKEQLSSWTGQRVARCLPNLSVRASLAAAGLTLVTAVVAANVPPRIGFTHLTGNAVVLNAYGDRFIAKADFNGDGRDDVLVGGDNKNTLAKTPIYLLVSLGDGTFRDATADIVLGAVAATAPFGVTADFNADGRPDVAIIDVGNLERGQAPTGGFYGEAPLLLLSTADGRLAVSDALALAVLEAERGLYANPGRELHAKHAAAADIDNDGDIDLFIESGGGFENLPPHFMLNKGDATFIADLGRIPAAVLVGPTSRWRHDAHALADMDGDGWVDLVLGQLKRVNNQQDALHSKVLFNDGTGRFPASGVVELPPPAWKNGYASARSVLAVDVNADGHRDVVIAYTRSQDDASPSEPTWSGRFLQVLIGQGQRHFADETQVRIGDQSAWTAASSPPYGFNINVVHGLEHADVNGDGFPDLIMGRSLGYVGSQAPLIHLGDGTGAFWPMDPAIFTGGRTYFGEYTWPMDLNVDGLLDMVHSDLLAGADGVYGTGDEVSRMISSLAVGPPPACSFQVGPTTFTASAAGGPASANVSTAPGCTWTASSNVSWVTVTSASPAVGSGQVAFSVAARTTPAPRSGTLTVAGRPLVIVQQGDGSTALFPPRALRAAIAGLSVGFAWTPPAQGPPVTGYLVEASLSSGGPLVATLPIGVLTRLDVSAPQGRFFVAVRAQSASGVSPRSNEVEVTTPGCTSVLPPASLSGAASGPLVSLSWSPSDGASAYVIRVGSISGSADIGSLTLTGTTLSAVAPAGTYYVRVFAQSACTESGASNEVAVAVGGVTPPGPPSKLDAIVSRGTVTLTWEAPSAGSMATGYVLEAGSAPDLADLAALALGPSTALSVPGVPRGTYYVRVRATNAAGIGPPSPDLAVVVP